jgi:glycosyltransferase involved in cell wall biosynthesis
VIEVAPLVSSLPESENRAPKSRPIRVIIPFAASLNLYGMERSVIDTFSILRPEVEAHFLVSRGPFRDSEVFSAIVNHGFSYSFFSDVTPWPKLGKPRSIKHLWGMLVSGVLANRDVFFASQTYDLIHVPGIRYSYYALLAIIRFCLKHKPVTFFFHDLSRTRVNGFTIPNIFITDYFHHTASGRDIAITANPLIGRRRNSVCPVYVARRNSPGNNAEVEAALVGKRNILFIGQVSFHKGIDYLLQAFRLIRAESPDTFLHILGGVPDNLPAEWSKALRNDPGVVVWGIRDDIDRFLKHADVLAIPSPPSRFVESFGRVVVEAMALGVPAVAFRGGLMPELLLDGTTGLVCEREDAVEFSAALKKILDSPSLREQMSVNCRRVFSEKYAQGIVRKRWLELLEALVPSKGRNRCAP